MTAALARLASRPPIAARATLVWLLLSASAALAQAPAPTSSNIKAGSSGLPLPRFVSLKADQVNMRSGAGTDYPTKWVFRRAGLPVEVLHEVEGWREVRDAEGAKGWVVATLLSGRRTALVTPWDKPTSAAPQQIAIKTDATERSEDVAKVEAGVIANIRTCNGRWCEITVGDVRGFIEQKKLWGVYPNEIVK